MLEQEIGQGWLEGVHPDDLERCLKARVSKLASARVFKSNID
jgi:hypothetical protein